MTTQPFSIAIKTYQRASTLESKTLALLHRHDISTERVTLFVANEQERADYAATLRSFRGDIVVQQEPGIRGVVRTYRRHYPSGTRVLHCDDDLIDLLVAVDAKTLRPLQGLGDYCDTMFNLTEANRCALWSVYAVANAFFMQNAVMAGLRFCSGCFHGFISDGGRDEFLLPTVNYKDDVEASIRYFVKYGAVLRDERVVPKTNYFKDGGGGTAGDGHEQRTALHIADANALAEQWSGLCSTVRKKSFGGVDVRMNPRIRPSEVCSSPARF